MSKATTNRPEMTRATTVPVLSWSSSLEEATAEPTSVVVTGASGSPASPVVVPVANPDDVGVPGTRSGTLAVVVEPSDGVTVVDPSVVVVGRLVVVGCVPVVMGAVTVVVVDTDVVLVKMLEVGLAVVELAGDDVVVDACAGGVWPVAGGPEAPNAKDVTVAANAPMTMTRTPCDRAANPDLPFEVTGLWPEGSIVPVGAKLSSTRRRVAEEPGKASRKPLALVQGARVGGAAADGAPDEGGTVFGTACSAGSGHVQVAGMRAAS